MHASLANVIAYCDLIYYEASNFKAMSPEQVSCDFASPGHHTNLGWQTTQHYSQARLDNSLMRAGM